MIPLEQRLRDNFAGEPFRADPEWEARVAREIGALPMVALLALFGVITASPAFGATDTLRWAVAMRSTIGIDSSGGDHATSWGYTLTLIGVYTDDQRTIVVLKGHGIGSAPSVYGGSLAIAGYRLNFEQSVVGYDGLYAVKFAALPGHPTPLTPVTLHLVGGFPVPQFWSFNFTLKDVTRSQTIPDPGRAGHLAIRFASVRIVPGALAIRFTENGASYDDLFTPAPPPVFDPRTGITLHGGGMLLMYSQVFDAHGRPLRWLDTRIDSSADGVSFDTVLLRTGPGPYRLVITAPDGGKLERTIQG